MPAAIPLIAGAFLAAGSVATAIGLGTAFVIGATAITWAAVLTVTGVALLAVSTLAMKTPKPTSGTQLQQKLDPQAPVPIAYGRTATGGYIVGRGTYGSKNAFYWIVTALSVGGPIAGIESYRAGDYPVGWSGNPASSLATVNNVGTFSGKSKLYKSKLRQRWQNGAAPANTTPAGASGLSIPLGALSGVAHAITSYEYNTDAFPQGLPSSLWTLRGVKLYDPRKDSTYPGGSGLHRVDQPSTYEFSENPYLAALQWALGRYENGKRVYGIGAKWSEIDVASFVAGANVADSNGWTIGGVITTGDDKFAVLSSLLASGGGLAIARGAQIACSVNAPKVSLLTLTREDVIGDAEIASSTSWRDRQNTIVPRYREESQNWKIISGERVSATQYVTEDAGEIKSVEVEYPLVQQAFQAHQLAAYELVNSREFLTFTVQCKLRLLAARVGDAITVDVPEFAAVGRKCVVVGREFNPADQSVTLSLKSETDDKHAFALGQTQVAPPSPRLDGYDPSAPDAPASTAWSISATQIANETSTIPALVINGEADDPNTQTIIVEYRPLGSTTWLSWGEFPRATTRFEITAVTDGTAYEVAISYRTVLNAVGERRVLTGTAGALSINWQKNVAGAGKPADNADVTRDNVSKDTEAVGGVAAASVTEALKDTSGNILRVRDIQASIDPKIKSATDAQQLLIDAAKKTADDAAANATKAADDILKEISRATVAEGNLNQRIDSVAASGGYDDTFLRSEVTRVETAYVAADRTIGQRIDTVRSTFSNSRGLTPNGDFTAGGANWYPIGFTFADRVASSTAGAYCQLFSENLVKVTDYARGLRLHCTFTVEGAAQLTYVGFQMFNAAGGHVGNVYADATARVLQPGTYTVDQLYSDVFPETNTPQFRVGGKFITGVEQVQLMILANYPNPTDPVAGGSMKVRSFWVEDVGTIELANAVIKQVSTTASDAKQAVADLNTSVNTRFGTTNQTLANYDQRITTVSNAQGSTALKTTVLEAISKGGGNLVPNSSLATLDGWSLTFNADAGSTISLNRAGYPYQIGGVENNLTLHRPLAGVGLCSEAQSSTFAVAPGSTIQFYCLTSSHRCWAWVSLFFFDIGGQIVGYAGENTAVRINAGGQSINDWDYTGRKAELVPANAVSAKILLRSYDVSLDGYAWFSRPFVTQVQPGADTWMVYSAGNDRPVTNAANARISVVETVTTNGTFAAAGRASTLEAQMNRTTASNLGNAIDGVNGQINNPGGALARISSLETVTTNGTFAAAQRASNLEAQMNRTSPSNLGSAIDGVSGQINNPGGALARISAVETVTTNGTFATATRASNLESQMNRTAPSNLGNVIDGVNGQINNAGGVLAKISSLEAVTTNGTFAAASTVNTLRSEYDSTAATVTTQAGTIAGLGVKTAAYWSVTADAGLGRAQLAVRADAYGGAGVDIVGDVQIKGQTGAGRTVISGTGVSVYDSNGQLRVQLGLY